MPSLRWMLVRGATRILKMCQSSVVKWHWKTIEMFYKYECWSTVSDSDSDFLLPNFIPCLFFSPPVKVTLWLTDDICLTVKRGISLVYDRQSDSKKSFSTVRILCFVFTSLKTSLSLTQLVGQNKTFEIKKKARFLHVNDTINVHKDVDFTSNPSESPSINSLIHWPCYASFAY